MSLGDDPAFVALAFVVLAALAALSAGLAAALGLSVRALFAGPRRTAFWIGAAALLGYGALVVDRHERYWAPAADWLAEGDREAAALRARHGGLRFDAMPSLHVVYEQGRPLEDGWSICGGNLYCSPGVAELLLAGGVFEFGEDPVERLSLIDDPEVCAAGGDDVWRHRPLKGPWPRCFRIEAADRPTARYELRFSQEGAWELRRWLKQAVLTDRETGERLARRVGAELHLDWGATLFPLFGRDRAGGIPGREYERRLDVEGGPDGPLPSLIRRLEGEWETPDGRPWKRVWMVSFGGEARR